MNQAVMDLLSVEALCKGRWGSEGSGERARREDSPLVERARCAHNTEGKPIQECRGYEGSIAQNRSERSAKVRSGTAV